MYDKLDYTCSEEMCEQMASECDTAIVAFSTGKDSIAAWLQMRKYFKKIVPYYCYCVPGLSFVQDSLKYYEDFFGQHIYQLPHRSFYRWIHALTFLPPDRVTWAESLDCPGDEYDDTTIGEIIRSSGHLPDAAYTGTGVRMADSPMRRIGIKTHGAVNHNGKRFFPVYDWNKERLVKEISQSGVKLPIDYKLFGRTFDGLDYRFLVEMRDHLPEDYARVLEWFPLADLEIYRREVLSRV